ncbi:MAG: LON peptidase substrate-binding domain-containing protein [Chloroflexi bacterium]|nr:LON peptidase substrate-binding domain-containing protein [Chloroflexota bacterium]MCY3939178.1 LON peptidase substrate-binding domain-containing protein [Chloroflexota bacterium]
MILDLFPLPSVLFPRSTMPLHIFEPRYLQMIGDCLETETPFGVILLKSGRAEGLDPVEIHRVGATAHIVSAQYKDNGTIDINVLGHERFEVLKIVESSPRMIAEVRGVNWTDPDNPEIEELAKPVTSRFAEYLKLIMALTGQWTRKLDLPTSPVMLAEYVSAGLQVDNSTRQQLLEQTSVVEAMKMEMEVLDREIAKLAAAVRRAQSGRSN